MLQWWFTPRLEYMRFTRSAFTGGLAMLSCVWQRIITYDDVVVQMIKGYLASLRILSKLEHRVVSPLKSQINVGSDCRRFWSPKLVMKGDPC